MPKRIVLQTIHLQRTVDGVSKLIVVKPTPVATTGQVQQPARLFDFTADELKSIMEANPRAVRAPIAEDTEVALTPEQQALADEKAEKIRLENEAKAKAEADKNAAKAKAEADKNAKKTPVAANSAADL